MTPGCDLVADVRGPATAFHGDTEGRHRAPCIRQSRLIYTGSRGPTNRARRTDQPHLHIHSGRDYRSGHLHLRMARRAWVRGRFHPTAYV